MPFQITNQRTAGSFTAQADDTILDAALRARRIFPYGCRDGVCGACKSELVAGSVDYGDYDKDTLSSEEIAQGKVLLCQAKPLSDVVIDTAETVGGMDGDVAIQIKKMPCKVAKLTRVAEDVMQVFLHLPKSQAFHFLPGQYIDLLLKDGQRRSFSIANPPADTTTDGLELHIRHTPGGHFSPRVFASLRAGEVLRLEGPFGGFLWQSEPARSVVLVAGGTGFAPMKCLIMQALEKNPAQRIRLFWGARDRQDLYLHTLAEEWARRYENFAYTPVLSADDSSQWHGARGWVHSVVADNVDAATDMDAYASGPPVMIEALRDTLCAKGLDGERFFFDAFTYAAAQP